LYCCYEQARVTVLMCDSSVDIRHTADSNLGWQPNAPLSPAFTLVNYQPDVWEAPTVSGNPSDPQLRGYYRWTRGMNRGVDFGSGEVNTGQPPTP
jgi:hypothetical protein